MRDSERVDTALGGKNTLRIFLISRLRQPSEPISPVRSLLLFDICLSGAGFDSSKKEDGSLIKLSTFFTHNSASTFHRPPATLRLANPRIPLRS